ncbi:MAG: DUF4438 domain-containing protein [candidate division WOR-3 bacterium]|nr:DUF4438 domain-containing protein [candidate division WOR-3 bacterium]MCX7757418.1 DUF4438 domain-containing protein [candidate division WOR-3 bacterium]MDW7988171.1 DUF4438 domain-containing protein [candidate division WOR-3 bacterium]
MLKTNKDKLVIISVIGQIASPTRRQNYRLDHLGQATVFPGTGGITYNVKVGDPVFGWVGDHIEPGVSVKNKDESENRALNLYTCIGNKAYVISGEAKGSIGIVTGKHGGIEHVLIWFPRRVIEKLAIGDNIQIRACGQGLQITSFPEVKFFNLDPDLLLKINPQLKNGYLEFPVAHIIPPVLMGSGLGSETAASGDYDITTQDYKTIIDNKLQNLRFGDLVYLPDTDNTYGRCYKQGAASVGIVVHSDCVIAGHGPGVTTIATSASGKIKPKISKNANIAYYLQLE